MAVTITNDKNCFNNKHLSLLLKDNFDCQNCDIKQEGDFILFFKNSQIVGMNIFNFKNYFEAESGFHLVSTQIKKFLLEKFKQYLKLEDFESFFKIGYVIEKTQHPSSEKLFILKVQFKNECLQIITNVASVEQDKHYLFALNGATTYSGLSIKESKVMNVLSQGMIVSYESLGMNQQGLVDCSNLTIEDEFIF